MASKIFYDCGCMEQGDQFFKCPACKAKDADSPAVVIGDGPSSHELYWLYRLQDALAAIEAHWICRCDLDCLTADEDECLRRLLGVLQDYSHGYSELRGATASPVVRPCLVAHAHVKRALCRGAGGWKSTSHKRGRSPRPTAGKRSTRDRKHCSFFCCGGARRVPLSRRPA
jgi:hypothetical protein